MALGVWCASWIDQSDSDIRRLPALSPDEAVAPSPLDPSRVSATPALDLANPSGMRLEQGGWVQIARPDGSLAQQYSAERLDPEPGQWLSMEQPRLIAYLDDGRVLTLRAASARTYVPQRALERGDFRGDVIAKIFEPGVDGEVHLGSDAPTIVFEAPAADVDFLHGTIRCPEEVRVTSRVLRFEGEDLDLQMSVDRSTIETMHVAKVVGPIVLDRAFEGALSGASGTAAEKPGGAVEGVRVVRTSGPARAAAPAPAAPAPFHRVTLTDSVRIVRYSDGPSSSFEGERLEAVLSLKGDMAGLGGLALPGAPESPHASAEAIVLPLPRGIGALALAAPRAHSGPSARSGRETRQSQQGGSSSRQDMIAIWAEGPLDVVRVAEGDRIPPTEDGVLLALDGVPMGIQADDGKGLRAEHMDLEMERGARGTTPRTLHARGGVSATDGLQTLWSSSLRARFVDDGSGAGGRGDSAEPLLGSAQVERADAEGGVELQLRDGARAWGERVQAWPAKRQADLHGPGVQVARGNALLHDVERIQVDEAKRTVVSPGSGRASIFAQTILAEDVSGRVGAPVLSALTRQSWAAWKESMRFEDRGADGAVLSVVGEVQLQSEPNASEWDRLDAGRLDVSFAPSKITSASESFADGAGAPLEARVIHAKQNARLESQVWPGAKDGSQGEPELFRILSEELQWMSDAQEAHVPVAGEMLTHRPKPAEGADEARPAAAMPGSLGTTRFRWQGEMHLEQRKDGLSQARLEKTVEIVHLALDRQSKTTLTCDRAVAVLERAERTRAEDHDAGDKDAESDPIQFGSGGKLVRLIAEGRCFLRSPDYDIDCESIEYDAKTQVAVLRARPGRDVTITPTKDGSVVRAVEATWDLATGRIRVQNMRGSVAR